MMVSEGLLRPLEATLARKLVLLVGRRTVLLCLKLLHHARSLHHQRVTAAATPSSLLRQLRAFVVGGRCCALLVDVDDSSDFGGFLVIRCWCMMRLL